MNLSSSKVFISVFLSAAPPRLFQTETLKREVEGPRGSSPIHAASGSSHDTSPALATIHHLGFLKAQPLRYCKAIYETPH